MITNDTPHTAKGVSATPALVESEAVQDPETAKHELPRGSGEPRFAPRAYYYAASRSGVLPSRIASAH
jgi:hypothetical protein